MLNAIRNALDFPLRQLFRWRRPGLQIRSEDKSQLFNDLTEENRLLADQIASQILARYHLQDFYNHSENRNYRINLYYIHLIEKALDALNFKLPDSIRVADIGVSDWFYAQGLYATLAWWHSENRRQIFLDGYEIDAYRVYSDFYSRYDHAMAHIHGLPNVRFIDKRFKTLPATYDIITLFFPFIFVNDHLKWGLPQKTFSPKKMLLSAWESLKPGGILIIVNQGEQEYQEQLRRLSFITCSQSSSFEIKISSILFKYHYAHFVTVIHAS